MDKQRIKDEAEAFFDWPTADKTQVTTTSALIFAHVMAGVAEQEERDAAAEWRKDAEAVLRKLAADGWMTDELHSKEGRAALIDKLLALKREARRVLSPPNKQ